VEVMAKTNGVILKGRMLGNITESWRFELLGDKVLWTISRTYPEDVRVEEMAMPSWHFSDLNTWEGGILDNGGMVWCKYLSSPNDTYGVHTGGVTFWNEDEEDGLRITPHIDGEQFIATK